MTRRYRQVVGLFTLLTLLLSSVGRAADPLDSGWNDPPRQARIRAYWWWLNGCVTKAAITRDLEQMKAKGFAGALICDADGSSQGGNQRAPHGPTFLSLPWRELYRHALAEADRLGLEMSLNIQSGWNLGGPTVTVDDAGKKLTWSEMRMAGPMTIEQTLPLPKHRDGYYRDSLVVAYPIREPDAQSAASATFSASSSQQNHPAKLAIDGDPTTFWVSSGAEPSDGPSHKRPVHLQVTFETPTRVDRLIVEPRAGYGPKQGRLEVSRDGKVFREVQAFVGSIDQPTTLQLDGVIAKAFRIVIHSAYDPRFPDAARNAQVAELRLSGPDGSWPTTPKRSLKNWQIKAGHRPLHFSAPDTTPLLAQDPSEPGEQDTLATDVINLSKHMDDNGVLRWDIPAGTWQVLRLGYTISDRAHVSTSSEGWTGYSLDVLDAGAFTRYADQVVKPLIADAGPLAGTALKYLHTDSWEIEPLNWTGTLPEEFRQRRGYDLLPWTPVLTGRIVENRDASNRFLHDFRKTIGDLVIDHHYRPFRDLAHQHKLLIHPESGGPHAVPIDAQRCLGFNDVPMSEFWAWSWRHRIGDDNRFFVKQPASAAHTYGHRYVAAEGFTTIGPHWQETLWDNLKPAFDKACCEGMNRLYWHEFVCSPKEQGMPGIQYFAGTHLNPNVTWWEKSKPLFDYINRCQFMLSRGQFVADACYYYGDHVPNFAQHKRTDPAKLLPGYDYDVITEEVILEHARVEDGQICLPGGMRYRVLVLRDHGAISLPVLRKVKQFVDAGATVVGTKPTGAMSLSDSNEEVGDLAEKLWGQGRIIDDQTAREVLLARGIKPDFEASCEDEAIEIDFIHRRDAETDIYFVANRSEQPGSVQCTFRVHGKIPELWDPVSGTREIASAVSEADNRTTLPIEFHPCGSVLVIFRKAAKDPPVTATVKAARPSFGQEIAGLWSVEFDPKWGGPGVVEFPTLSDWTEHELPGVKYYSGTAVYRKAIEVADRSTVWLDLGTVRELAEVKVNGRSCGIVWSPPFLVDISNAVQPGVNELEIEVVNFWPNRIIGDAALPEAERLTRTNIRELKADTKLMPSGLLGPVRILGGRP